MADGTFTQSGGDVTVPVYLRIGSNNGVGGMYNLEDGLLSVVTEEIGAGASNEGIMNQSGGIHEITDVLTLGDKSTGIFNLTGGTLTANNESIRKNGTFNQSGGVNVVNSRLNISSDGEYNLNGGVLHAHFINVYTDGIFNQTGGELDAEGFCLAGGIVNGTLQNQGAP